jgi:Bifunctional DNA primase/polymerase, N-terminal/Primase C terminal 2 (PriCT-2)/Family of unknown function (DUF5906)
MDTAPHDSLTAALDYVKRRRWSVFPVPPNTKKSYKSGRYGNNNPWGMTSIVESVEHDFKKWPEAGVGIPTGVVNRIFVVETDTVEGHGVDGPAGLRALEAEHGVLPETLMAESPTGSIHRYFAWPRPVTVNIKNSSSKLAPGVDVRGAGGMVVAPPTRTKKGQYRWINDLPIADPPRWLVKLTDQNRRPRRAPNPHGHKRKPVTNDELCELMDSIPNDLRTSWEDWNTVGMALYDATNGSTAGFAMFDEWSQKREDKYDFEKTEEKWAAYDTSPPTSIGVGKLFYLALCEQFEAEAEAVARLKEQGDWPHTPVEDAFDEITPEMLDEIEVTSDPEWLQGLNAYYAFIHDRPGAVFDLRGSDKAMVTPLSVAEFNNRFANKFAAVGGKKSISKRWFIHPRRREYMTAGDYAIGKEPKGALNLWAGLPIAPKPGPWPTIGEFLREVICAGDEAHFDYLRDLLFWKLQNPTKNPEVAIALQSRQGHGKGTFGRMLERLFGSKRFQQFIRADDATAKFNADAEGKMVLFYDEVFFGHDRRLLGRLKGEITERWLPIEPKGVNRYHVRNIALRVYVSNEIAYIPIDLDDRRVFALEVSDAHAKDFAYFAKLMAAIEGDELAALVHDALSADLSGFESVRREPPKTKARARLAAATARPEEEYLAELLERGEPLALSHLWCPRRYPRMASEPKDPWRDGQVTVDRDMLFNDYLAWMRSRQTRRPSVNSAEFHGILQGILGSTRFYSRQVKEIGGGGRRQTVLMLASLDDCREAFDRHAGREHEWSDAAFAGFELEDEDPV